MLFWKQPFRRVPWTRCFLWKESLNNNNSEEINYLANLQVESEAQYKQESSFAKNFPDFLNILCVFKILKQLFSRLDNYYSVIGFPFFTRFSRLTITYCTIKLNVTCQFISKTVSVIKSGFYNSKVKTQSFFYNHGPETTFLKFCPLRKLLKGTVCV